jgi:integrase
MLVAAGLAGARDHALISVLALNGLRISKALGIEIEHLGLQRGHRTVTVLRKGGKVVAMPLAPRVGRAVDLAIGERLEGPITATATGARMDRHTASRIVRRVARRAGIDKHITPHTLRHGFITAALDAGVPLRDVQEAASHADPRTTMRYDRGRQSLDRHATYIVATFIAGASRQPTTPHRLLHHKKPPGARRPRPRSLHTQVILRASRVMSPGKGVAADVLGSGSEAGCGSLG